MRPAWQVLVAVLCVASLPAACRRTQPIHARQYELTGQVLSVEADKGQITIKHDDIPGLMPAMTMAFSVKDKTLVAGAVPGDLVRATLVVTDEESYLSAIQKIGDAPLEQASGSLVAGDELKLGDPLPDIFLLGEDGSSRPLASYRGKLLLLTFMYTRCPLPDYCPRMDQYFARIQAAIKASPAMMAHVRLLSISFDPDHDTPARLSAHARERGADPEVWQFVTAPRQDVDAFGAKLGLTIIREDPHGENITHNLRTILVDREGRLVRTYNGNGWSPAEAIADLEALVR
jgi:protein SCO1/2